MPVVSTPSTTLLAAGHGLRAKVLGATRTTVLTAVAAAPGLTTAELANRARVSLASASAHATLLREAGLVISHRDRNRVRHYPTSTAMNLLDSPNHDAEVLGVSGGR
jgi:predicted transcriptional regulator